MIARTLALLLLSTTAAMGQALFVPKPLTADDCRAARLPFDGKDNCVWPQGYYANGLKAITGNYDHDAAAAMADDNDPNFRPYSVHCPEDPSCKPEPHPPVFADCSTGVPGKYPFDGTHPWDAAEWMSQHPSCPVTDEMRVAAGPMPHCGYGFWPPCKTVQSTGNSVSCGTGNGPGCDPSVSDSLAVAVAAYERVMADLDRVMDDINKARAEIERHRKAEMDAADRKIVEDYVKGTK